MADTIDIDIDHDKLIGEIGARNSEDHKRSVSAGESRQKIKTFLEDTQLNSQAYSWCRTILKKMDNEDGEMKAMDIIRSLKLALPMIEAHVEGQGSGEMDFDKPAEEPAKADADEADDGVEEGDTVEVEDDERVEFNDAVDETLDDQGNVTPFGARG